MLLDVNFWYKIFRNFRADRRGFAVNVCGPSFVADAGGTPMCAPTAQQRSSQMNFVVIFLLLMALAKIQTLPMGSNLEKIDKFLSPNLTRRVQKCFGERLSLII